MRTISLSFLSLVLVAPLLAEPADTHPTLSLDGSWVPIMIIIIGGMFLAAAVIGPIVRANSVEDIPPPAHSHDEPPGTSHHHGASGTVNPAPEHETHH